MRIFSLVENVIAKLGAIPGLQFLGRYVQDFRNRQTVVQQSVSRYQGYVQSARGAAADVKEAAGSKRQTTDDDDEYEEDIDEEYEEDIEEDAEDDFESYMQ